MNWWIGRAQGLLRKEPRGRKFRESSSNKSAGQSTTAVILCVAADRAGSNGCRHGALYARRGHRATDRGRLGPLSAREPLAAELQNEELGFEHGRCELVAERGFGRIVFDRAGNACNVDGTNSKGCAL